MVQVLFVYCVYFHVNYMLVLYNGAFWAACWVSNVCVISISTTLCIQVSVCYQHHITGCPDSAKPFVLVNLFYLCNKFLKMLLLLFSFFQKELCTHLSTTWSSETQIPYGRLNLNNVQL